MYGESSNNNANMAKKCEGCGVALDADAVDTLCPACTSASQQMTALAAEQPSHPDSQQEKKKDAEAKTEAFHSTPSPEGGEDTPQATECLPSDELDDDSESTALPSRGQEQPSEHKPTVAFAESDKEPVKEGAASANVPEEFRDALSDDDTRSMQRQLDFLAPAVNPELLGMLDKYEICNIIGRGGMGIVLRGYDPALDRVVAIKVLARELATNSTARKRFVREGQTAASVQHENVVGIYSVEPGEKLPYLVMKFIDGPSLLDKLDESGPLEVEQIVRIGNEIAMGLAAAHANNLVHRDIKPSNILLENPDEHARITDFGLARAIDDVHITQTGVLAGTPQFMSPEQARAESIDHRSDLFSLGCVLYACCTGRSPFRAKTPLAAVRRVCKDTPRPIREVNPDIPEWLVEIIDKLLEKNADDRFQTATELGELLGLHLACLREPLNEPQPARLHPPNNGSRRPMWIFAALVLLLGGGISLGLTVWLSNGDQNETLSSHNSFPNNGKTPKLGPNRPQPLVQNDREKFQGEWFFESMMVEGANRKTIPINRPQVKISGETWSQLGNPFRVDVDPAAQPSHLTFTKDKKTWPGIYQFKNGKLYVARARKAGGGRPKNLSGKTGVFFVMSRWKNLSAAQKAKPWFARADRLTKQSKWKESALAYQKGLELAPSRSLHWLNCAAILLETGDIKGYKDHCRKMLRQFGESNPLHAGRIAQACNLSSESPIPPATHERLSRIGIQDGAVHPGRAAEHGITLFRLGKTQEAFEQIQKHIGQAPNYTKARASAVLARVLANKGSYAKAYQFLGKAETLFHTPLGHPLNVVMGRIFLREAEASLPASSGPMTLSGILTANDHKYRVGDAMRYGNVYPIKLERDVPYLVDLDGDFDTILVVKDADELYTTYSDDVWFPNLNSRMVFTPNETGFHQFIVSSSSANEAGRFSLTIQKLTRTGPPTTLTGKLDAQKDAKLNLPITKTKYFSKRRFELHEILLSRNHATTITVESKDFNTALFIPDTSESSIDQHTFLPATPSRIRRWTKPKKLSAVVNSGKKQWAPHLSKDRLTLLYTSNRPGGKGSYDLWQSTRKTLQAPWSEPVNLGALINTVGREDHPHLSDDGLTLYYDSDRSDGKGKRDLWTATRKAVGQPWSKPVNLGKLVNTQHGEEGACLSTDGLTLVFSSDRPGSMGKHDLWICRRNALSDLWSKPAPLGPAINSTAGEHAPFLSHDGLTLLFQSDRSRQYQIWKSTRMSVQDPWSLPVQLSLQLGPENRFSEGSPWLSADGKTLVYHSTSQYGVSYLWMSRHVSNKEADASYTPSCSQITVTPMKSGKYYILVTSANEGRQGSYRFTVDSFDAPAPKPSLAAWLNRARSVEQKIDRSTWANVLKSVSHISNADKSYSYAIQLSPQNASLYRQRGQFYARNNKWDKAVAELEKSYQLDPKDYQSWKQLFVLLQATGKTKQSDKFVDDGIDRFANQLVEAKSFQTWSAPVNLGKTINTPKWDTAPCLSADGLTLYFQSDRLGSLGKLDIWMSKRTSIGADWGMPVRVGGDVNSTADERGPFISADGLTFLFTSNRNGVHDVWQCTRKSIKSPWSKASRLGPPVNSSAMEQYPSLSADRLTLMFTSQRDGGKGRSDIWMCTRKSLKESWSPAVNLRKLNTEYHDSEPRLSGDGLTLLFSSTRPGGVGQWSLWKCTRDSKDSSWSVPVCLGPNINSTSYDGCPTLSADGAELIFHSGRRPGEGLGDLWMSRRVSDATTLQKMLLSSIIVPEPNAKSLARIKKLSELFENQPTNLQNTRWSMLARSARAYHEGQTEEALKLVRMIVGARAKKSNDSSQLDLFGAMLLYRLGDWKTGSIALKRFRERVKLQPKMNNGIDKLYADWLREKVKKLAAKK